MKIIINDLNSSLVIKKIREELNLTQEEFARKVGMSVSSVKNYEQGRRKYNVDTLIEFCNKCKIDICIKK